jgi:uncharacterized repeat protein (TIGR03803 family)
MTATLTTLASFDGADGAAPYVSLIADADGDLFGTTIGGGADGYGTVFEIAKTAGGYANTPTTLVSFNGADGRLPQGSLIADVNGDLFGTTELGGGNNDGTVFEIFKTAAGYASTPITLVSFNGADGSLPTGSLIADGNGDLFGTTTGLDFNGNTLNDGAVFEIAKTAGGYASAPTTLVSFNGANGEEPFASLIADAHGDLFGTTGGGGANEDGTVFEIAKTAGGYASTPTTLASFNGTDGDTPLGSLIADSHGDLFGTTEGGANSDGTVFEIVKTPTGYASTPTTLVGFNGANGSLPAVSLIADANGDLFGTTIEGGANDDGTVFEIKKTAAGYASAPTTLVGFNGTKGSLPNGSLIADANGDLFGTTEQGGPGGDGTVFEITGGGFALVAAPPPIVTGDILWQNTGSGQASIWEMDGNTLVDGGAVTPDPGPSWIVIRAGDFNDDGHPDLLWQNATTGQASIWEMSGSTLLGGGAVNPNPGPSWRAVGTGDFNKDGDSDILWQNTNTGQASIWEMNGNSIAGGGAVTPNPGPAWKAIGTGDFNKDADSDILWQNTSTGQVSIWEMDGNKLIGGGAVSPNPGPAWKAIGTGDFNHDGFSDILFQNKSTGQVSVWEMDGTSLIGGGKVNANPGPNWHAIGTGAGGSDILLQNTSGQTSIWEMSGNTIASGGPVSPNPGPNWHAIGLT